MQGSFWVLQLYDVSDEIDLEKLRAIAGSGPAGREPAFVHSAPSYVRFQNPPAVEPTEPFQLSSGEHFSGRVRYFDYGTVSIEFRLDFTGDWAGWIRLASRWISDSELEHRALESARHHVKRVRSALLKPYDGEWTTEDYYLIHIHTCLDEKGQPVEAEQMLREHGGDVAQIVRGEHRPLSKSELHEILQSSMSYYPTDLLVIGWVAAFIYDTPESASPSLQLLAYANTQLLQYRHYDAVLTEVLGRVYKSLERKRGVFSRWRLAGEAEQLNTIRLDVTELTERTDNAIKFLSDMFYARAYRLAAGKIGVTDYRNLVDEKLRIAGELYDSMVNEFHQARAFVLEVMVVFILIIEILYAFRGKN